MTIAGTIKGMFIPKEHGFTEFRIKPQGDASYHLQRWDKKTKQYLTVSTKVKNAKAALSHIANLQRDTEYIEQ